MPRVVRIAMVLSAFAAAGLAPGLAHAARLAPTPTTWCGGTSIAVTDRKPDLLAGNQINVVFAHPLGSPDRFAQYANYISSDVAAIDGWWRKQDATRTPRFDLFAFPGCGSTYGKLDLADVTLPQDQTYYSVLDSRFDRLINTLVAPPFLLSDTTRKYVIYYDAPVSDSDTCGQGGGYPNLFSTGPSWAVVYVQTCGLNLGDGNHAAHVVTHELLHSLGAVPAGAPHECAPPDDGHVCDSPLDILYPFLSSSSVFDNEILDVNRDDYYGTGSAIDIRNSLWLQHLDVQLFALTVATAGSGTGSVASDVGGIACPSTCSSTQAQGTVLTLTATADAGSRFAGWGGACSGTGTCSVTFDAAKSVTATFAAQVALTVTVDASHAAGTVTTNPASALSCPGTCTASFDQGQTVTLVAQPGSGARLEAWGGACSGRGDCTVTLDAAKTVTAFFGVARHRLTAAVSGKGRIVSSPAGLACPGRCSSAFDTDSAVALRAIPATGYKFAGWSGACKGKGGCSVTMRTDAGVKATFKKK